MDRLLSKGGGLSAYRSNPSWPVGPVRGSWARQLERDAETIFMARHVIACANATLGLIAALRALDLPPGEVVTTPFTFSATSAAIRFAGHEPVFADVSPATFCLDPDSVATVLGPQTRAILPVDLFGRVADYGKLRTFGLPIVQDASQAVGAVAPLCQGDIAVVSFNGSKNLPAGEAGAILTDSRGLAERVRRFASHGENWGDPSVGLNARINEPTALIAWHGLKALGKRNAARRHLGRVLIDDLLDCPEIAILPDPKGHALYTFSFALQPNVDRKAFAERVRLMGIEISEGYIRPILADYPAFKDCRRADLSVVRELSNRTLCVLSQVRPPASVRSMRWLAAAIRTALAEA